MPVNDNMKWVYDQLTQSGANMGTIDDFEKAMGDENNRKWAYDYANSKGMNLGSMDDFTNAIMPMQQAKADVKAEEAASAGQFGYGNMVSTPNGMMPDLRGAGRRVRPEQPVAQQPVQQEQAQQPQVNYPFAAKQNVGDKMWDIAHMHDNEKQDTPRFDYRHAENGFVNPATQKSDDRQTFTEGLKRAKEDDEILKQVTLKPEETAGDVYENAMMRFSNTEEGIAMQDEAEEARSQHLATLQDEFTRSKEYKDIVSHQPTTKEEAAQMTEQLNQAFQEKYGAEMEKFMQPYQEKMLEAVQNRYGDSISESMRKVNAKAAEKQVTDLQSQVNEMQGKQGQTHGGTLRAADHLLEETQEVIDAAKRGDTGFLKELGQGFWDNILDARNYTWGISDALDATNLKIALDAAEKGEQLSKEQEALLDVHAVNMIVSAYFGSDLSRGYKAGQMSAESIPFMIDIITNPISASGNAVAKGLLKYGMKKFGAKAVNRAVPRFLGRVGGESVAAAGMTSTTGLPRVLGETIDRLNANFNVTIGDDGKPQVQRVDNKSTMEALSEAVRSNFFEYQSESVFNALRGFNPLKGVMSRVIPEPVNKIIGAVKNSGVGRVYRNTLGNQTVKEVTDRAQFHGLWAEYMEEVYNNFANVATGDMSLKDATDLDKNIDTFLGLAPTSVLFGAIGVGGYAYQRYQNRKNMNRAFGQMNDQQREQLAQLQEMAAGNQKEAINREVKRFLQETIAADNLTQEEKRAEIEYLFEFVKQGAINEIDAERTPEERAVDDVEESRMAGYDTVDPDMMNEAVNDLYATYNEAFNVFGNNGIASFEVNPMGMLRDILENNGYTDEEKQIALDYVNAKAKYNGMVQRVRDDIDGMIQASDAEIDSQVNTGTGMVQPATLKVDNRQVHIIDGNVALLEDGSIDTANSTQDIIVRDAQTGKVEFVSPSAFLGLDEAMDPAALKQQAAENIRQTKAQQAADQIDGVLPFQQGDTYNGMDAEGQPVQIDIISDNGDGTVNVGINGEAAGVPMQKEAVQQLVDNARRAQAVARREDAASQRAMNSNLSEPSRSIAKGRDAYSLNEEIGVTLPDGSIGTAVIDTEANADGQYTVRLLDANGNDYFERPVRQLTADQLNAMQPAEVQAEAEQQPAPTKEAASSDLNGEQGQPTEQVIKDNLISGEPIEIDTNASYTVEQIEEMAAKLKARGVNIGSGDLLFDVDDTNLPEQISGSDIIRSLKMLDSYPPFPLGLLDQLKKVGVVIKDMPMIGEGEDMEPDFAHVSPQRAQQYLYDESGLEQDEADDFVKDMQKQAGKNLQALQKKKPKLADKGIDNKIPKFQKAKAAWQQQVDDAERKVAYWNSVEQEQAMKLRQAAAAVAAENAARQAAQTEQAIKDEAARKAEEAAKAAEQAAVGANNVNPVIREKWNAAPKVEGNSDEMVLANGERIPGRYVLVESGAASASHNALNGFRPTEGFPVDENGQSVNDRDYERDTDAQDITRRIADNYDQRALQTPVVVSSDGVVLSGNGRTMAGELAASQNTDQAYTDYLRSHPERFGFTAEQVGQMQHPRVVFVPDGQMPYTAETFGKFNQQEMKGQSKSEQAVKLGKVVDDQTFGRILRGINRFDSLGAYYNDTAAATEAVRDLQRAGAISEAQLPQMFDGDTLSPQGREILENTLIGKAFEGNPDAVRMITAYKGMRQSVVTALSELANNVALGEEYSLQDELAQAIALVYEARNKGGFKAGERVSSYAMQGNLFQLDEGATVADYENATVLMLADVLNDNRSTQLKKIMALYNQHAAESASGQMDIFSGGVQSKEDIIKFVQNIVNYGTEAEQQAALDQAREQRKQEATAGNEESVPAGESGEGSEVSIAPSDQLKPTDLRDSVKPDEAKLGDEEIRALIDSMKAHAVVVPVVEITDANWKESVKTPIGSVKMGENQKTKFFVKGREKEYGMTLEALANPDIVLEEMDKEADLYHERPSSYLFIKTFIKEDGSKYVHFESVTVSQDGMEVSISSHVLRENQLKGKLKSDRLLYKATALDEPAVSSAEQPTNGGGSTSSENKDNTSSDNIQENQQKNEEQIEKELESRIEVQDLPTWPEAVTENGIEYHERVVVDGKHNVLKVDAPDEKGNYTGSYYLYEGKRFGSIVEVVDYIDGKQSIQQQIEDARKEVDQNPTEAQKEAGNYKKGHIKLDGYDISIENPKGSTRSGVDEQGKEWSVTMNNDYGYLRGTEGVDGDHIDVFLSDNPTEGNVFVVDQVKPDGSFDEHKVMYGFATADEARAAYLANYSPGWNGLGAITEVSKDEFKKWVESSHRKTKPFAEYKSVKPISGQNEANDSYSNIIALSRESNSLWNEYLNLPRESEVPEEQKEDARKRLDEASSKWIESINRLRAAISRLSDDELAGMKDALGEDYGYISRYVEEIQKNREVQRTLAQVFEDGIASQGEVSGKDNGKDAKPEDYTKDNEEQRPILHGTFHDPEGYAVVTNARVLLADKNGFDKSHEGQVVAHREIAGNKKGEVIEGKFPGWKNVVNPVEGHKDATLDTAKLLDFVAGAEERMKSQWKQEKDNGNTKQSFSNWSADADLVVRMPDGTVIGFNFNNLKLFAKGARQIGAGSVEYTDRDKRIAARSDNGVVTVMPKLIEEGGNEGRRFFYDMSETKPEQPAATASKKAEKKEKTASASVRVSSPNKIEDFGEKIGGARKDVARGRIRDTKQLSVKDLTTLKKGADDILSQANILRLYREGQMDEKTARSFMAFNNVVKLALKRGYGNRDIVLEKYRDAAVAWEEGKPFSFEITEQDVRNRMAMFSKITEESARQDLEYAIKEPYDDFMQTYEALNYPAEERKLGNYVIKDYTKSKHVVSKISYPFWVKNGYHAQRGYPFRTLEDAVTKIKKECPIVETKEKSGKKKGESTGHGLHIAKDGFAYYVKSRNIPGTIYLSRKFFNERDAKKYLEDNLEKLKEKEQRMVDALLGSSIGMVEREGADYRGGKDVTPQDFLDEFGFRGVEFGNWVPQAERQLYLNKTYDAIEDLCAIVGISPKAFSLGGRLALAFGARGHSRAMAHYETGKEVINLTRMSGAGSLAHEWFHALDNYLARQKSGNVSDFATETHDTVRDEVGKAFSALYDKMRSLDYNRRSKRAGEYWGRTLEEFARLFENYIYNKLAEKQTISPVLVREDTLLDEIVDEYTRNAWPYPSRAENEEMKPLFDRLFETIQEKTDAAGNVVLFQKVDGSEMKRDADMAETELRDALIETMREAGIDVITDAEAGQQVLDEDKEHRSKLMGTKVEKRKKKIAAELQGKKLDTKQQAIVDVFVGKKNRTSFTATDRKGKKRNITMIQGSENGVGTKHSIFRHYETLSNEYYADEILYIPQIIEQGDRKQNGDKVSYSMDIGGVVYTVTTEQSKKGNEKFTNFYTNRKSTAVVNGTSNTANQHAPQQSISGTKLQKVAENAIRKEGKNTVSVQFFRTSDGQAYGFTLDGKIYIDPRIATAETPIHEYGHLWTAALRKANPAAWERLKEQLLGQKDVVDYVKSLYPELEGDVLMDEIFQHYAGKRGAERLRSEQQRLLAENKEGAFGVARIVTVFDTIRRALQSFWNQARDLFAGNNANLKSLSAEDFADMMMADLLNGYKPDTVENSEVMEQRAGGRDSQTAYDFATRNKGVGRVAVVNAETGYDILRQRGVDAAKAREVMNAFKAGDTGRYLTKYDLIIAFDDGNVSEKELNSYLWHEATHRVIHSYGIPQDTVNAIASYIKDIDRELYDKVMRLYGDSSEEVRNEEVLAWFMEDVVNIDGELFPSIGAKISQDPMAQQIIDITKLIRYGRTEQSRVIFSEVDRGSQGTEGQAYNEVRLSEGTEGTGGRSQTEGNNLRGTGQEFSRRGREIGGKAEAREAYEAEVARAGHQVREALQDSMRSLHALYKAVLGDEFTTIDDVPGFENAYTAENRLSSESKAQQNYYKVKFFKPLVSAMYALTGINDKDGSERMKLTDYMMAKHGLERNVVLAERDARRASEDWLKDALVQLSGRLKTGEINQAAFDRQKEAYERQAQSMHDEELAKNRKTDYAGLTALTGKDDVAEAEAEARKIVADYETSERKPAIDELWEAVRNATHETLRKTYEGGLMSKDAYESTLDMFQYYIPMRGFDEQTSDEVYDYLTSNDGPLKGSVLKTAEGRRSKADDPITYISQMADKAIMEANRNRMKQTFMNFVLNHPSDLVSVSDMWIRFNDASGEWEPELPPYDPNDSSEENERKRQVWEENMKHLAASEPKKYKRASEVPNIPYRVLNNNLREHQVLVKRNGRTYILAINGSPRAAQALNGLTNPDTSTSKDPSMAFFKGIQKGTRFIAQNVTSRSPGFMLRNFIRDGIYANVTVSEKENKNYAAKFMKNYWAFNPATMHRLFKKWEKGELNEADETEKLFMQFMMNGGETGYTSVRDIEQHRNDISKALKAEGSKARRFVASVALQLDLANRSAENVARFAAFVTSRQMGRSLERSIYDAKEVSVNFNKKGSGGRFYKANGETWQGTAAEFISSLGRANYAFWNPAIQGTVNFARVAKRAMPYFLTGCAAVYTLGMLQPVLWCLLWDGDGDDDKDYYNLPEYTRRSNICIRYGDKWITIPLPPEMRALYGMGELAASAMIGKEKYTAGEIAFGVAEQLSQLLPIDMLEGKSLGTADEPFLWLLPFAPTWAKPLAEIAANTSWTGLPIYKDSTYDEWKPEWQQTYKSTSKPLTKVTKWLNSIGNDDENERGPLGFINPAAVEHVLSGYLGGLYSTFSTLWKEAEWVLGLRDFEWRNTVLAGSVVKGADERTANSKTKNNYYHYKEEAEVTKRKAKRYEKGQDEGIEGMAEKYDFLYNSPEYGRMEIFERYRTDIDRLNRMKKEAASEGDDEAVADYDADILDAMRRMNAEMEEFDRKK